MASNNACMEVLFEATFGQPRADPHEFGPWLTVPLGSLFGSNFRACRTLDVDTAACAPHTRQFGSVFGSICSRVFRTLKLDFTAVPLVIVGDSVHDIAGMGADLFRSFGKVTCAALLHVASPIDLRKLLKALMYFHCNHGTRQMVIRKVWPC